jgi:quercetin dioxygenase-like cupin family protein
VAVKAAKKSTTASKKPGKPPKINWGPQQFMVSHLKDGIFKAGLRAYAQYRDLGVEKATNGAAQAHVIRLKGKCDPKVVSIPHYHGVQFQMIYFLKGWMVGEYEGFGRVKMTAGSCWIQPPGIRHTVLDYSPDCEMVEIILPAQFKTVEVD